MSAQDDIRGFIIENFLFGDAGSMIGNAGSLIENEIIDSTAVLELVAFIEERFAIAIDDAEIVPANLDSVEAIVRFVGTKTSSAAA